MSNKQALLGTIAAVAFTVGISAGADAATILGQACSVVGAAGCGAQSASDAGGDIFKIDTTTGVATRFLDLGRGEASTQAGFSPNAFGYNGTAYRTSYNPQDGSVNLFANDTQLTVVPAIGGTSTAAGDVYGNTFYYLVNNGNLSTVNLATNVLTANIDDLFQSGSATLGDIAISPDGSVMYVSFGSQSFGVYNFSTGKLTTINNQAGRRYAGLGFGDDGVLYGFTGGNAGATTPGLSDLYALNTGTGTGTFIAQIRLDSTTGTRLGLTDGASVTAVPLPAALPLAAGSLAGLMMIGRRRKDGAAE